MSHKLHFNTVSSIPTAASVPGDGPLQVYQAFQESWMQTEVSEASESAEEMPDQERHFNILCLQD